VAVVLGILAVGGPAAGPAAAHTELVSSTPAAGEQVAITTDRLVLEFGEDLLGAVDDVVVRDSRGDDAVVGAPGVLGSTLTVPLHLTEPGRYTVAYRVMGRDGHLVTGTLWFSAAATGLPLAGAAADPRDRPPDAAGGIVPEPAAASPAGGAGLRWGLPTAGLVSLLVVLHLARRRETRGGGTS
jgi:methionine-rich copper-binding protein CopC